jgi:predicted dehydrogenase
MTNLKFPSGVGAHIFVSWLNPFKEQRLVVVGDQGMLVFDVPSRWSRNWCITTIASAGGTMYRFLRRAMETPWT